MRGPIGLRQAGTSPGRMHQVLSSDRSWPKKFAGTLERLYYEKQPLVTWGSCLFLGLGLPQFFENVRQFDHRNRTIRQANSVADASLVLFTTETPESPARKSKAANGSAASPRGATRGSAVRPCDTVRMKGQPVPVTSVDSVN